MEFWSEVVMRLKMMLPMVALFTVLYLPFIALEQIFPARERTKLGSYAINILISVITLVVAMPFGMIAEQSAEALSHALGWQPLAIPLAGLGTLPAIGPALKGAAMILAPLLVHDLWFYWSHRIEHKVKPLWAFHSLHHSDPQMNCTTSGRDHFGQTIWRAFFSVFTLGLVFDIDFKTAGEMAQLSTLAGMLLSRFYHSAIRVQVPWLDRLVVTPQVHRIHHSTEPAHYNRNFGDFFPFMDLIFGTYEPPVKGEFPATGLPGEYKVPRDPITAQFEPLSRAI